MPYASFTRINKEREKEGEAALRQPPQRGRRRPAPAGSRADPEAPAPDVRRSPSRRSRGGCRSATHSEELDLLAEWGFQVEPNRKRFDTLEEVQAAIDDYEAADPEAPDFQADGVVVKVDSLAAAQRAGRGRRPGAALGHRPEVRARSRRDSAARHPGQRGPHRRAQSLGGAGAGADQRGDGHQRDACTTRT